MTIACSNELLQSALTGDLPPEREQLLQRHLEECETCAAALESMAGDAELWQEAAAMFAAGDLDEVIGASRAGDAEWSDADFSVEHLEPSDEPGVLGRLGGYDVLEIIGRGGMGVVLKGYDPELKRCVAIKILSPQLAHSSLAKKRFAREAQAAAAVVHPNVLAIHQVQPGGRLPFLVMPLVAGESLAQRLAARGRLELDEVLRIGMQAAAALAAAHEQGLVHRDVKPANILLEKGVERAVLTDFGLARAADDVSMTRWGIIAGTPQYMSPEQAQGEAVDGRSDLFSLGCVLYEMASGVSPFKADTTLATLRRLIDDPPPALAALNPELPPWFIGIVQRLLEKDPARRFASAKEVSELLEGCLAHLQQPANVPLPQFSPLSPGERQGVRADRETSESEANDRKPRSFAGLSRRKQIVAAAIGLLFLGGLLPAFGILIRLKKGNHTTTIEVPEGSTTRIDAQGAVTLELASSAAVTRMQPDQTDLVWVTANPVLEPHTWRWKVHLPKGKRYIVSAAYGKLPAKGFPARPWSIFSNERDFESARDIVITAGLRENDGNWSLSFGAESYLTIPKEAMRPFQESPSVFLTYAGTRGTEKFNPDVPITLLRRTAGTAGYTNVDSNCGILIWLRPWGPSEGVSPSKAEKASGTHSELAPGAVSSPAIVSVDVSATPGGPWVGKLAQYTVELVGVVESPGTKGARRWKPDGSAASAAPFSNGAIEFLTPSEEPAKRPRLILLHIRDLPDDSPWPVFRFEPSIGLRYLERPGFARDNALRNYYVLYTLLDKSTPTAKLGVGIDSGAWETVVTQQPGRLGEASYSRDGKDWKVTFLGTEIAGKDDDTTVVALKTNEPEGSWRMRLVAIARDGSEHPSWLIPGSGFGTSSGVGRGTATFDRLPLTSIKEFRLQVRPFSWVEFTHIALEPREVTSKADASVSGAPAANSAPTSAIQLRFFAWQDETKKFFRGSSNGELKDLKAWRADGSRVDTEAERAAILHHDPGYVDLRATKDGDKARILDLWFSYRGEAPYQPSPGVKISIQDKGGHVIPAFPNGVGCGGNDGEPDADGNRWFECHFAAAVGAALPPTGTVVLEYPGPWKAAANTVVPPDLRGAISVYNSTISIVGQSAKGRAFVSIARRPEEDRRRLWDFRAECTDGKILAPAGWGGAGGVEQFEFDVPLSQIKLFRLGERRLQRVEFHDVAFAPGQKTDVKVIEGQKGATNVADSAAASPSRAADPNIAAAERFLDLLSRGDFDKATADFDDAMKKAVPPADLKKLWDGLAAEAGRFKGRGPSRTENVPGAVLVYVPANWEEHRKLEFKVALDKEGRISGLWLRPETTAGPAASWQSAQSAVSQLAGSPQVLRTLPTARVIAAGFAKPLEPWAWQELDKRPLTAAEATQIVDGVTQWLRREHPAGSPQKLFWLDDFLNHLAEHGLVTEKQKIRLVQAVHGDLRGETLLRRREGVQNLNVNLECRCPFEDNLLGLTMMNELQSATVDGRPLKLLTNFTRQWNTSNLMTAWQLPALAPGKYLIKVNVLSALVAASDLTGLDANAPSADWPPAKKRWTRTAEMELVVHPRDAVIVGQTQDPALDPVRSGGLAVQPPVILRPKGAGDQAALNITVNYSKLPVPVSFAVTLRIAGQKVPCGQFSAARRSDNSTMTQTLTTDLVRPDATVRDVDVILTPDAKAVDEVAAIDRIWGKEAVFHNVPLKRLDLGKGGGGPKENVAGVVITAGRFVDSPVKGDFDKATADFDDKMKKGMPPAKLKELWYSVKLRGEAGMQLVVCAATSLGIGVHKVDR